MRKYLLLSLMALLPMTALITVTSCSGDDEVVQPPVDNNANNDKDNPSGNNGENLDIHVIVNDDGTTSNGSIFSAIDNQNFYVDYIKYTVTEGHLTVSGYDKTGFKGIAKIISKLTYKGNTYEVLEIGDRAFYDCTSLTSVIIPSSVTSIGSDAFYKCSSLTSVHITDIKVWCNISFSSYSDSNPLSYAHHLYLNGKEIIDLVIPDDITSIGRNAFCGCSSLTSVTIPNSVTSIGDYAFFYCTSLTSITIPNSVTSIGIGAFSACSSLTSITIPYSVTSIGSSAFYYCTSLTSITIPNSVNSIGSYAFYGCRSLTSVNIPNSVTSIGNYAFYDCRSLTTIIIPSSVTSIGEYAFRLCCSLTSVTIGSGVTSIGEYAFFYCTSLTSITIPNSVTSIGNSAFWNCTGLTSVTIGSGVTSIGRDAFDDCTGLTDVYCYAENVPSTYSDAFENSPISSATLHVPARSVNSYKSQSPWSSFGRIVAIE